MRVKFKYKNHRGEIEDRDVDVVDLRFDLKGHPDYGYQPGWAISGHDYSRGRNGGQFRSFQLSNIIIDKDSDTEHFIGKELIYRLMLR